MVCYSCKKYSTSNSCKVLISLVKKNLRDTEVRFLIFNLEIAGENFAFMKLYNQNTEFKQIKENTFADNLLNLHECSQIVCTANVNPFPNNQLKGNSGKPTFKSKYVSKF